VDNGPEFTSRLLDQWAYRNGVALDFIRPGKPTDNAVTEAFSSGFRQECLNKHSFLSVTDAPERVKEWRRHHSRERPHSSLGNQTLQAYVNRPGPVLPRPGPPTKGVSVSPT
jgi:putative transposase